MTITLDKLPLDLGDAIARLLRRYYPIIFGRSYSDAAAHLGTAIAFNLEHTRVQAVLGELARQVRSVADTTRSEIQDLIGRQAAEGWSITELAEQIRQRGEIASISRSAAIARTETAAAYSKGSILAYQASGVVRELEWLATLDEATSPECAALHGTRAPLGKPFADGTEHPPRHPNCRCTIIPIVEE